MTLVPTSTDLSLLNAAVFPRFQQHKKAMTITNYTMMLWSSDNGSDTISPQHTLWYWNSPGYDNQSSGLIRCTAGQTDPSISKKQSASEHDYLALQVTSLWSITMSGATQPMTQCKNPQVLHLRTQHCFSVLMHEQPYSGKKRYHWLLWDCSIFELVLSLAKIETTSIKGHPLTQWSIHLLKMKQLSIELTFTYNKLFSD